MARLPLELFYRLRALLWCKNRTHNTSFINDARCQSKSFLPIKSLQVAFRYRQLDPFEFLVSIGGRGYWPGSQGLMQILEGVDLK